MKHVLRRFGSFSRNEFQLLLFVRRRSTWRAALEMKDVVFCSACAGPCSLSCSGAGVGQISSLSNRWFLQSWRMNCAVCSSSLCSERHNHKTATINCHGQNRLSSSTWEPGTTSWTSTCIRESTSCHPACAPVEKQNEFQRSGVLDVDELPIQQNVIRRSVTEPCGSMRGRLVWR